MSRTPRQKQILQLMSDLDDLDVALIYPGTRGFSFWRTPEGDLVIKCYQEPDRFLAALGFIEETGNRRNAYRLTEKGRQTAARLKRDWRRDRLGTGGHMNWKARR